MSFQLCHKSASVLACAMLTYSIFVESWRLIDLFAIIIIASFVFKK
jgi:hypothetical protein